MRKRLLEFAVLISIALGAGPVGAAIWNWSTTAGNNATADPSINWAEGMAPSSVNDSARAMMAVLASWRNDISAVNTTGGSSTAYTLTTSEGVNTTPANGQMISMIINATNGASPTLTVDGGNTYPIWLNGSALGSGTLIAGSPYRMSFSNSNSAWQLEGGYSNPFQIALGGLMTSTAPTPPNSNFVWPAGQCISTTTYAAYWVQQGSPASGSCPGGQFAIIDLRGTVLAGLDTPSGFSPANRLTSNANGCGTAMTSVGARCANGAESYTMRQSDFPNVSPNITVVDPGHTHSFTAVLGNPFSAATGGGGLTASSPAGGTTGNSKTGISASIASINGGVTQTPQPQVPPISGVNYFLRIL